MANEVEDHVARLKQGVTAWNAWRADNASVVPNLSDANLRNADLIGANLSGAKLSDANLSDANLSDANLYDADLIGADLRNADLRRANLSGANLIGANLIGAACADLRGAALIGAALSGANLSDADLIGADLGRADLSGANLSGANLSDAKLIGAKLSHTFFAETSFTNVDLSNVIDLDTCQHQGPSSIDSRMQPQRCPITASSFTDRPKPVCDASADHPTLITRTYFMTLRSLMRPAKANELFAKLSETSDGAVKTRERLFAELKADLEFHTSLEEQHLFPVLRRNPETKDLVADAIRGAVLCVSRESSGSTTAQVFASADRVPEDPAQAGYTE